MVVYIVTSQVDYDYPHIEGVWSSKEEAVAWIQKMYDSWESVGDYHTDYFVKEYTVK
jgi:hypothetical protein